MKMNRFISSLLFLAHVQAFNMLSCNSDAQASDNVMRENKFVGSPSWPKFQEGPYNCNFNLAVDATVTAPFVLIEFIVFETNCNQRSRVWVMEGGKQQVIYYCGRKPIRNYIARTGKLSVGIDIGKGARVLVSYRAIERSEVAKNSGFPKKVNMRDLIAGRLPTSGQAGKYQEPVQIPESQGSSPQGNSQNANAGQQAQQYPQHSQQGVNDEVEALMPSSPARAPSRRPTKPGNKRLSAAGRIRYVPFKPKPSQASFETPLQLSNLEHSVGTTEEAHVEESFVSSLDGQILYGGFGLLGVLLFIVLLYLIRKYMQIADDEKEDELSQSRKQRDATLQKAELERRETLRHEASKRREAHEAHLMRKSSSSLWSKS